LKSPYRPADEKEHRLDELPAAAGRSRRKAAMSFAGAVAAALVSVLGLHGWHIYIGLGLTLIAALYGLMRWSKKYPLQ
jgi:4-hydroxybenzoate polyprenyltransferase